MDCLVRAGPPQITAARYNPAMDTPRALAALPNPALMGIVNITPNSFSDGNQYLDPAAAVAHARQLAAEGAAILDLGAEASSFFRPGVEPVLAEEQLRRLLPVLNQLSPPPALTPDPAPQTPLISIDTRSAAVARRCVATGREGEMIINDISAGTHDPAMFSAIAELGCPIILMHIAPTYPDNPPADDPNILETVAAYLRQRVAVAIAAGIHPSRILLDPGIGFGKTPRDNMTLALRFPSHPDLPFPIVLGLSRKRFLTLLDDTHWLGFEIYRRALLPYLDNSEASSSSSPAPSPPLSHDDKGSPHPPPATVSAFSTQHSAFPRDLHTAVLTAYHAAHPQRPHGLIHRVHDVALNAAALRIGAQQLKPKP